MGSQLILGAKWSIVVEAAKDVFNVAGHGKDTFVVGIIPPKGDATEKGAGPISGYLVTRVG